MLGIIPLLDTVRYFLLFILKFGDICLTNDHLPIKTCAGYEFLHWTFITSDAIRECFLVYVSETTHVLSVS